MIEEDRRRIPVELNIRAARKRQSAQTGFVHHCYETHGEKHDTIPIYENACFVLALLRTKLSENMHEGLKLLRALFHFECEGNFPVYLHEFPACKDRMLGLKLLPVLHAIFTDFHTILDSGFRKLFEEILDRVRAGGYVLHKEGILPVRYAQFLTAFDEPHRLTFSEPKTKEQAADALLAAHIARCKGAVVDLEPILSKWHEGLCIFLSPQPQEKGEPKPTLFDLFLCERARTYPKRILNDHPMHLSASLVYPLPRAEACKTHAQKMAMHLSPFTLYWGSSEEVHSLVCESEWSHQVNDNREVFFSSAGAAPEDGSAEISLFCNLHPSHVLFVNGQRATTFQLGDTVEIHSDGFRCRIIFSLVEGEGIFCGRLSRANRSSQTANKGAFLYEAYDWQIGLRTLARTEKCTVRVSVDLISG